MPLNTRLDSNVLNFLMSGKHFRSKKFSQQEIFATWCLIVKISKISASQKFLTTYMVMGQFCIEITDYSVVYLITSLHSNQWRFYAPPPPPPPPPQTCSFQNVFVKIIYCVIYKST